MRCSMGPRQRGHWRRFSNVSPTSGSGGSRSGAHLSALIRPCANASPAELSMVTRIDDGLSPMNGMWPSALPGRLQLTGRTNPIIDWGETDGTVLFLVRFIVEVCSFSFSLGSPPELLVVGVGVGVAVALVVEAAEVVSACPMSCRAGGALSERGRVRSRRRRWGTVERSGGEGGRARPAPLARRGRHSGGPRYRPVWLAGNVRVAV